LINPQGNIVSPKVVGLVDSGADTSTFPVSWAAVLGIDVAESCLEYETDTAGGKAQQFLYEPGIYATFMGHKLHLGATFSHSCGAILLGRTDFFRYCRELRFDQQGQQFHIELVDDMDAARKEVGEFIDLQATLVRKAVEAENEPVGAESP
jgi:hypothetical protein